MDTSSFKENPQKRGLTPTGNEHNPENAKKGRPPRRNKARTARTESWERAETRHWNNKLNTQTSMGPNQRKRQRRRRKHDAEPERIPQSTNKRTVGAHTRPSCKINVFRNTTRAHQKNHHSGPGSDPQRSERVKKANQGKLLSAMGEGDDIPILCLRGYIWNWVARLLERIP